MSSFDYDRMPKEFEEDLIALDHFRNDRIKVITMDPRIEAEQQKCAFIECAAALVVAMAVFVAVLAALPT